jgi:NADH-quinone oxidoreductase subunit L
MSGMEIMLIAGVLIPLASFVLLALWGARIGKPLAGWVATGAIAASCVLSIVVLIAWQTGTHPEPQSATWFTLGSGENAISLDIGVNLDSLTVIMFFMVAFVSTWIHVFSIGYMAGHSDEVDGQSKYHRFFCYLSLFCFSMLGLVISNSLLFMYIFWELVGLCSYLLIGFYFDRKYASDAGIKAFVTNRVGDFGFLIGLAMVALFLNDLSLSGAANAFEATHDAGSALFTTQFMGLNLATWMGILLFCGAVGKSAQFPLHVWLPDAMAGPTPVSALIHAATMVAAGVYLVARIFVLLTPEAQMVIAATGCITLTIGALVAIVQTDIKKVLAYSTVSQLGYMILGMGVGAWIGALFHLLTHAFFKALMFLCSGQVIEGCHHEQDIRKMGGLRDKMPITCWTFLVGVLAIAGVGIPMTSIGIGGFFSKDEILLVAYQHTEHGGLLTQLLFWVPVAIVYITPLYMLRCWWLTFMGTPRDEQVYEHAHERPLMYVPLIVLAVGTLIAGPFLFRHMVAEAAPEGFLVHTYDGGHHPEHGIAVTEHTHHEVVPWIAPAFVVGFIAAWLIYRKGLALATAIARTFSPAYTLLVKKFYFDELYNTLFVGGIHVIKAICDAFDKYVVDGVVNLTGFLMERLANFSGDVLDQTTVDGVVNGVGETTWRLGGLIRQPQTGRIRNYILFAVGGVTLTMLWMLYP